MKFISVEWIYNQRAIASTMSAMRVLVERLPYGGDVGGASWTIDNLTHKNLIDASFSEEFDYSRGAFPYPTFDLRLENETPDASYALPVAAATYPNPMTATIDLGYKYEPGGLVEVVPMTQQRLLSATNSDDDLVTTISGAAFTSVLDDTTFYGGRWVSGGIAASTLFAEILDDADFPVRGWWNYILGDAACKASTTQDIWADTGYAYYHIDPSFDSIMVEIPIPPVSHRKALTMLAAYVGAYLIHRTDGSLHITPTSERVISV